MSGATHFLRLLGEADALGGFGFDDDTPSAPVAERPFLSLDRGSRFRIDGTGPTYEVRGAQGQFVGSVNPRPAIQVGTAERHLFLLTAEDPSGDTVSLYLTQDGVMEPVGSPRKQGRLQII